MQMEFTSVEGMNEDAEAVTAHWGDVKSTPMEVLLSHARVHEAAEALIDALKCVEFDREDVNADVYGIPMEGLIEETASALSNAQDIADFTRRIYGALLINYAVLPSRDEK